MTKPANDHSIRQQVERDLADMHIRLRNLRLHLGLTEKQMGSRVGISDRSWRRRERTPYDPAKRERGWSLLLVRLSEEFDVSIDWLCTGTKGGLSRNDHRPLTPSMRPMPPRLRLITPKPAPPRT